MVSRTSQGKVAMFAYFKCFPHLVWALVFLSALTFTVLAMLATRRVNVKSLRDFFWNYTCSLTLKPMESSHIRSVPYLINGLWLSSALVLTTQFTAYLLDYMIKGIPLDTITTIEELSKRNQIKVVVRGDSLLSKMAAESSAIGLALSTHMSTYLDFESEDVDQTIMKGLTDGSVAYVNDRLILFFTLLGLKEKYKFSFDSLHISTESSFFEPYFLFTNDLIPKWAQHYLDKVYVNHIEVTTFPMHSS